MPIVKEEIDELELEFVRVGVTDEIRCTVVDATTHEVLIDEIFPPQELTPEKLQKFLPHGRELPGLAIAEILERARRLSV